MKLKVFRGFYLFVTIKPCCTVVKKCVYPSPKYCVRASTAPLVFFDCLWCICRLEFYVQKVWGRFSPFQMIISPFICSFLYVRMQFSLRSECIIPVAEVEALHCVWGVAALWADPLQGQHWALLSDLLQPRALSCLHSCEEGGLKNIFCENVALW